MVKDSDMQPVENAAAAVSRIFGSGVPDLGKQVRPGSLSSAAISKLIPGVLALNPQRPSLTADPLKLLECVAMIWHDRLQDAHAIAQSREGDPGFDLAHAILHRREGDFPNSLYWFTSAGTHPCYPRIPIGLSGQEFAPWRDRLAPAGTWSPGNFVAAIKNQGGKPDIDRLVLMKVQAVELRSLALWILA